MSDPILVFRVVGWDRLYETAGTLKKPGPRAVVPAFTDLGEMRMQRMLDAPGGFEAFGVWNIVWRLAARCVRRGTLLDDGVPVTVVELARLARCAVDVMSRALQTLCTPGVGLLEQVPLDEALRTAEIVPVSPKSSGKSPNSLPPESPCISDAMIVSTSTVESTNADIKPVEMTLTDSPPLPPLKPQPVPSDPIRTVAPSVRPDAVQRFAPTSRNISNDGSGGSFSAKSNSDRQAGASSADGVLKPRSSDIATLMNEMAEVKASCHAVSAHVATLREARQQLAGHEKTVEFIPKLQPENEAKSAPTNAAHSQHK